MKILPAIVALSCFVFLSAVSFADGVRLSEPVASDDKTETFGAPFDQSQTESSLSALLQNPNEALGKTYKLQTRIGKVCQKKGCFFIAQEGSQVVRVSFKDYGFFIPTDANGKTVQLIGELVKKEMSEEQAAHFNEDLGNKAFQAGDVFEFIASSVKIPKSV